MSKKNRDKKELKGSAVSHVIKILYNYILCRYNLRQKKVYFENIFKAGISKSKGALKNLREIEKYITIFSSEQLLEINEKLDDKDRIAARRKSEAATEYFDSHFVQMMEDTLRLYDKESVFAGELAAPYTKDFGIKRTSKIMQDLTDNFIRCLKNRFMDVPKAQGDRNEWTAQKYELVLRTYDELYDMIKTARNRYKTMADAELKNVHRTKEKRQEILNMIKVSFPAIPDSIFEKLKCEDITDSFLAMEAVNEILNLNLEVLSIQTRLSKIRNPKDTKK